MNVIILAAGNGTRMGDIKLPKALLPYKGKAIVGHIVEAWSTRIDYKARTFYVAEQDTVITDYLKSAYPGLEIVSVVVPQSDLWEGPIRSMMHALKAVKNTGAQTVVTVADGVYTFIPPIYFSAGVNIGVAKVEDPSSYLMVYNYGTRVGHASRCLFIEKPSSLEPSGDYVAWSGVVHSPFEYLYRATTETLSKHKKPTEASYAKFFENLQKHIQVKVYRQDFLDLGTKERYLKAVEDSGFDYSKPGQVTYTEHFSGQIVKYFDSQQQADNFCERYRNLQRAGAQFVLPPRIKQQGNFVSYLKVPGTSASDISVSDFVHLLNSLDRQLWHLPPHEKLIDEEALMNENFMFVKAQRRMASYCIQLRSSKLPTEDWSEIFKDWPWGTNPGPGKAVRGNVHGDLTLDNIIRHSSPDEELTTFTLIDWRTDLGNSATRPDGDIYYDLSKLWVSLELDLQAIKRGEFTEDDLPHHPNRAELTGVFKAWCDVRDLSYPRVVTGGVLLMAAMCGVHKEPFARAVYNHSLKLVKQIKEYVKD